MTAHAELNRKQLLINSMRQRLIQWSVVSIRSHSRRITCSEYLPFQNFDMQSTGAAITAALVDGVV
jgi:hypothetical protein